MTDSAMSASSDDLARYLAQAEDWLDAHAARRAPAVERVWGEGDDSQALFHNLSPDEERQLVESTRSWQRLKADADYGSIDWAPEHGGAGLPSSYARAFARLEASFVVPPIHEAVGITLNLVGPTLREWGTPSQVDRFLVPLRRTDEMWCQLFSEPGAGSDLARLSTRAREDGDEWVIDGQKVWTSGAQFADYGYAICRTDSDLPKHVGLTAFIIPMNAPGVTVRPLRQMSGGSSFNEVFFDGVRIPDALRLGDRGAGWRVAMTTLGFERASSTGGGGSGRWNSVRMLAEHVGATNDSVMRQRLTHLYTTLTVLRLTNQRVADAARAGLQPGPEGSLGKLAWTEALRETGDVVSSLLGPALAADTGAWGTFTWSEFINGTPGFRVAGGSDEVQRNIIGERVLGLPTEPRLDRDMPFRELMSGTAHR